MLRLCVLIGSLAVAAPSFAHDFWSKGEGIAEMGGRASAQSE
jgi:hypothetical protein